MKFRQDFGFEADEGYIEAVEADPQRVTTYGVALTPAEDSEMTRRGAIATALEGVQVRLEDEATFGGLYLDQAAGGVVDLAQTTDGSSLLAVIQSTVPAGTTVRLRKVAFAFKDLQAVMTAISNESSLLAAEGIVLSSVEIDIPSNRVVVGVVGNPTIAQTTLAKSYGDAVYVDPTGPTPTPATCTISNCPNPLKGGLGIQASYGGTNYYCTSGYFQKIGSTLYMVTAGHCLEAGTGIPWYHPSTTLIGYSALFQTAGTADAGFITSSETGPKNEVLAYIVDVHPTYTIKSIGSWVAGTSQVVGTTACKAGLVTGWTCGQVLHVNVTVGSRTHLNEASDDSQQGDSGGTVMNGVSKLYGQVSLTDSVGDSWYVPPDRTDSFFGGSPCITASC